MHNTRRARQALTAQMEVLEARIEHELARSVPDQTRILALKKLRKAIGEEMADLECISSLIAYPDAITK